MKKIYLALLAAVIMPGTLLSSCSDKADKPENVYTGLFPRVDSYWVGDVMPMTENDKLRLFYLFDKDNNGSSIMHPFWSFTTDNFYEFTDDGLFLAPTDDVESQDYFGLGTGSVLKVDDVYHCFYTGVNVYTSKPTAIMHGISTDGGKTWDKQLDKIIYPPEGYSIEDYRDPDVKWMEEAGEYWLTISARTNTNGQENGVVLLYTSPDLQNWTVKENIFEPNHHYMLECTDIRKIGDYYYLFYSWNCITYYAMSDSLYGPYTDPADNILSGDAFTFYAGKTGVLDGRTYLCAWIGRKIAQANQGMYEWGGNMVIYEVLQKEDGTLALDMPHTYREYFNKEYDFTPVSQSDGVEIGENSLSISAENGISYADMGALPRSMLMTCKFTVDSKTEAGVCFSTDGISEESKYIAFNVGRNRVQYDAKPLNDISISGDRVGARIPYTFEQGKEYTLKMVVEEEIISLYVNGEKTLINRLYDAEGKDWGFFSAKSGITFTDIELFVTDSNTTKSGVSASAQSA